MELVWRGAFLIMGNLGKIVVVIAAQIQTRLEEFLPDLWMMSRSSAAGTISPFHRHGLGTFTEKEIYRGLPPFFSQTANAKR